MAQQATKPEAAAAPAAPSPTCTQRVIRTILRHTDLKRSKDRLRDSPRQLMKNLAVGVSAPLISSSVVTMPGLRLWTPTLRTPCCDSSARRLDPSCARLRLVAPYAANLV